jgi:NhaP-type Na+/H+ or K+/H+ antiporter
LKVLPYGWDFNLAMAFGSILAATDPVAVVALLKAVGASPKLTMQARRVCVCVCECV